MLRDDLDIDAVRSLAEHADSFRRLLSASSITHLFRKVTLRVLEQGQGTLTEMPPYSRFDYHFRLAPYIVIIITLLLFDGRFDVSTR